MSKRRPDSQLTQSNWDDEIEEDEAGQFQKADAKEMQSRIILAPKRRLPKSSDQNESTESVSKAPSVFSNFSLLSKSSTTGAEAVKPMFSFPSKSQLSSSNTFGISSEASALSSTIKPNLSFTDNNTNSKFESKLKELNNAIFDCIKGHIESGKLCILSPIFKDYDKYVAEIKNEGNGSGNGRSITTATTIMPQFSFGDKLASSTDISTTKNDVPSIAASPVKSNILTPTFSFGKTTPAITSQSGGFSFSNAIQQASNAAQSNNDKNSEGTNGKTAEEEESDEPPKVEFVPVVEENIYSKRCKVFVKDDGDYKDRGTGTLYLKSAPGDKVQLLVRADTNLGNILLNILLTPGVPAKLLKNNVVLVCIPTPESEPKPKSVLVRVKTQDDAKELLEEIQKHQK